MVSMIIPVYNGEKFIRRCMDSVVNQSFSDLEIILVNDGSKDRTKDILMEYAENDYRVIVISQENSGVAAARNTGLRHATGEFILYVDADDWIEQDMVQQLVNLAESNVDIVFCSSDHANNSNESKYESEAQIEIWNQNRQLEEFMRHKRMTGMLWNKLIRRSLVEGVSFNERTGYGEDAEFLWKILKKSKNMVVTNKILYHHVLENTSISHLSFSEKKYSAISMWEEIVNEVREEYPELLELAIERLMCSSVFSMYEIKKTKYNNVNHIKHIEEIVKKHYLKFMKSPNVSKKMKLYATSIILWGGDNTVSVIVPIYNTEKYLEHCLDSIQNQTYNNIEVIMINDGSSDNSEVIARKFTENDLRFRLYNQQNVGVSAARNRGLDLATGDYILFIDSDDWIEPNMIEVLVQNIEKTNSDISCCQYDRSIRNDISGLEVWTKEQTLKTFLIHKKINGSLVNKLLKKHLLTEIRFDKSIRYGEDALFLWKVFKNASSLCITSQVLYHVVLHDDSASGGGSYKPIRRDCIRVWESIAEDSKYLSEELKQTARAQLGNMAFFSLYEMMYYGYKNIEHQKTYLNVLHSVNKDLCVAKFIPLSEKILTQVFLCSVHLGRILVIMKKMIKRTY